ncbi:aldolase [Paenibacillus sp. FSL R7-277]|uniref:2-amino-3,7-dideoxy-D-threo-hept-6-ulosonate synthase n=1 Tax=Paenibacillus sp. FSL R7-277 TaxID=1227352 RepID=UPI0003E2A849|nr:2-amino-3,7-dideoxy-D-threo-hept-6-ulosonate synthase [Paenibacillus sp. FSL R7-277]ETT65442.1 aldolase [Paenibacillus sp. FSL R7-277]
MNGKQIRLQRLIPSDGKLCIVPLDHGVTNGPLQGLENIAHMLTQVDEGGADAVVMHKGLLRQVLTLPKPLRCRLLIHLSASTVLNPAQGAKVLVATVEEAVKLGADGISMHVNLGVEYEPRMLEDLGRVAYSCEEWGMPLLVMIYAKNGGADTPAHAARVAQELGADIVKIEYPGSREAVMKITNSVHIPVIVAGGIKQPVIELLQMVENSLVGGASGIAMGRNIFQHPNPKSVTQTLSRLIHREYEYKDCLFRIETEELDESPRYFR